MRRRRASVTTYVVTPVPGAVQSVDNENASTSAARVARRKATVGKLAEDAGLDMSTHVLIRLLGPRLRQIGLAYLPWPRQKIQRLFADLL